MHKHNIHIALIQESKLKPTNKTPTIPQYSAERQDRLQDDRGGGLITYIHNSITYIDTTERIRHIANLDNITELQAFKIKTDNKNHLLLINVYIPPTTSVPGYEPNLQTLNSLENTIIGGDFNASHENWYLHKQADTRGNNIADQLNSLYILNDPEQHTREPYQTNHDRSSPDITFCSPTLATTTTWNTHTDLTSDHLPIIIKSRTHPDTIAQPRNTITNYTKANWEGFTEETDIQFENLNITPIINLDLIVFEFNKIVNRADKQHIPKGNRKNYNPNYSPEIKRLTNEYNNLRKSPTPHSQATSQRIQELSEQIYRLHKEQQTEQWKKFVATLDHTTSAAKLFKTIRSINNSNNGAQHTHQAITNNQDEHIPTRKQQANIMMNHYANISNLPKHKEDRRILRRKHSFPLDSNVILATTTNTRDIIKQLKKSGATGIDNISNIHLKHLGPHGIRTLTNIANYSYQHCRIPNIWKIGKIIPLLKMGKKPTEAASYRPVTLLCTPSKVVERLILKITTPHIPLSPTQHGFRPHHSTTTLLTDLTQRTLDGFNEPLPHRRTLLLTIDISKAFDAIPRLLLTNKIYNTTLHNNTKRWLANYLTSRQAYVHYNGISSSLKYVPNGVPQGSVLSPTLFNLYLHDLPPPPPDVHISSYADDITISATSTDAGTCSIQAQQYLNSLQQWLTQNRLKVAPAKSTSTLLTNHNLEHRHRPNTTLNNTPVPHTHTTKILGVTYNTSMSFGPHIQDLIRKCTSRVNALRALSGTTWGQQKETLLVVFKQGFRSLMAYASAAWAPTISPTLMKSLQTVQNGALKIITGATSTTPIKHLHAETRVLTIKQHLDMKGTQFIANALHNTSHPCHYMSTLPPRPRPIKNTPHSYYNDILATIPRPNNISRYTKHIHTQLTRKYLRKLGRNKVLGRKPPLINVNEKKLSREDRVHLTRLRCGHHPNLNTYKNRLDNTHTTSCPNCQATHTVTHIGGMSNLVCRKTRPRNK